MNTTETNQTDELSRVLLQRAEEYRQQADEAAAQAAQCQQQSEAERSEAATAQRQAQEYRSEAEAAAQQAASARSAADDAKDQAAYHHNQAESAATNAEYYERQAAQYESNGDHNAAADSMLTAERYWSASHEHERSAASYDDKAQSLSQQAQAYERQASNFQYSAAQAETEAESHETSAQTLAQEATSWEGRRASYEADAAGKETIMAQYEVNRGHSPAETKSSWEEQTMSQATTNSTVNPWEPTGTPREHMPHPEPEQVLDQGLALYGDDEAFLTAVKNFEAQMNSIQSFDLNTDGKLETLVERFDRDHDGTFDAMHIVSGQSELIVIDEGGTTMAYFDQDGDHVMDTKFEQAISFDAPYTEEAVYGMLNDASHHLVPNTHEVDSFGFDDGGGFVF